MVVVRSCTEASAICADVLGVTGLSIELVVGLVVGGALLLVAAVLALRGLMRQRLPWERTSDARR